MKKLGHSLLVVGFLWVLSQQLIGGLRGGLRKVVDTQYSKLSVDPSKTYSKQEMQEQILETARATHALFPLEIAPGLLMFAGGLLLGRSGSARASSLQRDVHADAGNGP